jgi:hypothetical protein
MSLSIRPDPTFVITRNRLQHFVAPHLDPSAIWQFTFSLFNAFQLFLHFATSQSYGWTITVTNLTEICGNGGPCTG